MNAPVDLHALEVRTLLARIAELEAERVPPSTMVAVRHAWCDLRARLLMRGDLGREVRLAIAEMDREMGVGR